jgi:hypothetical protein
MRENKRTMIERRNAVALSTLVTLVVVADVAAADPAPDRQTPSVTAIVGTDVGLDLAAGVQVETPFRLRLTATVGWLPRTYAWGFKEYYQNVIDGPDAVGEVLADLLAYALVVRANVGVRPIADLGLFVAAGYTFQRNNVGGLLASDLEAATGRELPGMGDAPRTFETTMRGHLVDATVGWQWAVGNGFSLQAALGLLVIVRTRTTFSPQYEPADPTQTQAFVDAAEKRLEDAGTGTVAPEATLFLGYTF